MHVPFPRATLRRRATLVVRRFWWPRLRRRTLFVLGGIVIGVAAVLMEKVAGLAQAGFSTMIASRPLLPFALTPLGFALVAAATRAAVPNARGSGIPQVIAARGLHDLAARRALVSVPTAVAKIALLGLGLLVGASAGREGPTVQVGAAVMLWFGRFAPHRQPGLLIAGAAAGVAAAFNAPLAGIVFGIEEMSRSFEVRTSGLVLGTVITAGLTSLALVGDYTAFGAVAAHLPYGAEWLGVPVAGLAGGVAGGLFSRVVVAVANGLPGRAGRAIARRPILFAAFCGLAVAVCGWASNGSSFGTGYDQSRAILAGEAVPAGFGAWKLVATALTALSGIPGGIFSPSLSVGAGLGAMLHPLVPAMPIATLAVLCMAAYLAGVVQAPLTSFVIVGEMTADHAVVFPMMVAVMIAYAISRALCPTSIYHALARGFGAPAHA